MRLERYQNQWWIGAVLLFATSLFFSRWFWPDLTFLDGDSFYHIKITELLSHGIPRSFPWLPYTILNDVYIDHHLLYHAVLFPFIYFFGPFAGAKIATVLLAAAALVTFYLVLRGLQLRMPLFFSALLLLAPGFMFRMNLAKAPAFSVILFLLGLYFLWKRRAVALGVLIGFYVWAYGGWPLLACMVVVWVLAQSFLKIFLYRDAGRAGRVCLFVAWIRSLAAWENARLVVVVAAGALAGLIINPYFPRNLWFYWYQFVQIGVINYQSKISVGAEWYPAALSDLLGQNAVLIALFGVCAVFLVLEARRRSRASELPPREEILNAFGAVILAGVLFVFTARSRRMIEYFVPTATLALAALTTLVWPSLVGAARRAGGLLARRFYPLLLIPVALGAALVLAPPVYFLRAYRAFVLERYTPHYFSGVIAWLTQRVPAGSLVFHDRWDIFPMLLLGDARLRYMNGLDPTFFYLADPERYALWRSIIAGEYAGDVAAVIREQFNSKYVVLTDREAHALFRLQLELSSAAEKAYEDGAGAIFLLHD